MQLGRLSTTRAAPIIGFKSLSAGQTHLHPWLPMMIPPTMKATPKALGTVSASWKSTALNPSTNTKARLVKG